MSIASELQNYADGLDDAYDAVNDMSGIIPQHKNMDNLDQAIRTIPQSSGPTPGDGVLTIQQNGTALGTFSANQSTNTTVNITGSSKTIFTWENGAMYDEDHSVASGGDVYSALQSGEVEVVNSMSSLIIENGIYAQWPDPTYGTLNDVLFFTTERTSYAGVMTRTQYLYDETNGWLTPNEMDIQERLAAGSNITISNGTISATDTTYSDFTGATSSVAGASGLAPAPAAGDQGKFLKGNGTWGTPILTSYSTTEQDTGMTWTNGEKIYRKVFTFDTQENQSYSINISSSNVGEITNMFTTFKQNQDGSGVTAFAPYANNDFNWIILVQRAKYTNTDTLFYYHGSQVANLRYGTTVLEYTKTGSEGSGGASD